jgi:hypothetical protein
MDPDGMDEDSSPEDLDRRLKEFAKGPIVGYPPPGQVNQTCNETLSSCNVSGNANLSSDDFMDIKVPFKVVTWQPIVTRSVKQTRASMSELYGFDFRDFRSATDLAVEAVKKAAYEARRQNRSAWFLGKEAANTTKQETVILEDYQTSEPDTAEFQDKGMESREGLVNYTAKPFQYFSYPLQNLTPRDFSSSNWSSSNFSSTRMGETRQLQRRLSSRALAIKRRLEIAYINPLSMRAPQECMSGTYCNERAAGPEGTGPCPAGSFCPPGVGEPQLAPEGVFVLEAGRVRGTECFPGQYAPDASTPECFPCPPGMKCSDFGTTVPYICPPGTYRKPQIGNQSASSISCEPCGAGTWAPWRGTPSFAACEPCPEGRVCPVATGNVSQSIMCPEGHICGEATTVEQQTGTKCYDGFFCAVGTTPSSVYQNLCLAGFYCAESTSFVNRYKYRCQVGFYCPTGTGFKKDFLRKLIVGDVYLSRQYYYITQILATFCVRQMYVALQREVIIEQRNLEAKGMPVMAPEEVRAILSQWESTFRLDKTCQRDAVETMRDVYWTSDVKLRSIHRLEFLVDELMKPIMKNPAMFSNKCAVYDPEIGEGWPAFPICEEDPDNDGLPECPLQTHLQCLCTAPNMTWMFRCFAPFEPKFPDPECTNAEDDTLCLDPSLALDGPIVRDDFDLMSPNYISYVQAALTEEMIQMRAQDKASSTRCPFGTITEGDGKKELKDCLKRYDLPFTEDRMNLIVDRINPVDMNLSSVNYSSFSGDPGRDEEMRYVFKAMAKSIFLVTFDVRHLTQEFQYGKDWKIKFFINETLNPDYDDPIECSSLIEKQITGKRDELIKIARAKKCTELELPYGYISTASNFSHYRQNASIAFVLFPSIDAEWRVEVQIINGLFMPDRFMLARSAVIEEVLPQRAQVGTNKIFGTQLKADMPLELPYNLPLKTFPDKESTQKQEELTWGFINWLPIGEELQNSMRHPKPPEGQKEYFFRDKGPYFENGATQIMAHVPYFSNCRGFGRTPPLWTMVEQGKGCVWIDKAQPVSLLSIGQLATGDKCTGVPVECILDEVPNVKMTNPRWFEATTGSTLFYATTEPMEGKDIKGSDEELSTIAVRLKQGAVAKGELPKKVVLAFQYWQQTETDKYLASGRVYYMDFEKPSEEVLRGKDIWVYNLEVLYFPMSHFEVMVNFAFPANFYFTLYVLIGFICVGIMSIFWLYHWLLPDVRVVVKPKLRDRRYWDVVAVPLMRGLTSALLPCTIPLIFGIGIIRGVILGFRLPGAQCGETQMEDTCLLGMFDWLQSSYSGETPVTVTSPGERRTGRTGTGLVVMGAYAVIQTIKLLIPMADSDFYEQAKNEAVLEKGEEDSDASSDMGNQDAQAGADPLEKIFTNHLWKRSCLGLAVYCNAMFATVIMQFSFSNFFGENVLSLLIALYLSQQTINVILCSFLHETLLVIPINNVNQVTFLVCLLAAPTLFDFIVQYLAMMGIQIINRIYISPNRDKAVASLVSGFGTVNRVVGAVLSRRKPEDNAFDKEADDDDPAVLKARADALASAIAANTDTVADEQAEDMIAFLGDMSTDTVGNIITPVYFVLCRIFANDAKILYNYNIAYENAFYYVFFYIVMLFFQFFIDCLSINVVELYHGWHVLDYFEYCQYRFKTRSQDWKGRGQSYDETVPPHLRSLDQFCFSEQYIFVMVLAAAGMMTWILGIQILFVNNWNVFDDPATVVITFGSLAWCRAIHIVTLIAADYLHIWKVSTGSEIKSLALEDLFMDRRGGDDEGAPTAPKGSMHESWPEPSPRNFAGMERYCHAFLNENQLWLQLAFAEMSDRRLLTQHRESLLRNLAQLLEELEPEKYSPDQGLGTKTGLEFAVEPVGHLTIAAGEIQKEDYKNSIAQELVKMWRHRAQFMLHLARVSSMVKLDNVERKERCEICGRSNSLVVTPIYTLTHLASSYRQQRDMSPLWNMVFWKHFYKTFTPTCTTCEECRDYYYSRDQNVPVDEKRFRRLQEREKSPFELVQESQYQPVPIDRVTNQILHWWLQWTRRLAAGEHPRDFLPEFGIEGRTMAEMRQEQLQEANREREEEDTGIPPEEEIIEEDEVSSEEDPDDPESVERHRMRRLVKKRGQEISDDEGEDWAGETPFAYREPEITWASRTLAVAWLSKARQNMIAPQLQVWAQPLPPALQKAQEGLPRVPHAAPTAAPAPQPGLPGPAGLVPTGFAPPGVPAPPPAGAAAVTGPAGLPPDPTLAPPPGGGDIGGGVTGFLEGQR